MPLTNACTITDGDQMRRETSPGRRTLGNFTAGMSPDATQSRTAASLVPRTAAASATPTTSVGAAATASSADDLGRIMLPGRTRGLGLLHVGLKE